MTDRSVAVPAEIGVSLRWARPGEEAAIVELVRGLAAHAGDPAFARVTPDGLREALHGPRPCLQAIVAEAGGGLVGICLYSRIFSTWRGVPGFYVIDLYVMPEARGARLGERLLARLASEARTQGGGFLRLDVEVGNTDAHRFYRRLGFAHVERDQSYALGGEAFSALAASDRAP